jgi:hypothetical protein
MDNRYWSEGCPPLMQDGKFITNYVRGSVYDQYIRNMNKISGTHEYRNFLQNKGEDILKLEMESLVKNNTCQVDGKCVPVSGNPTNILPCPTQYTIESFRTVRRKSKSIQLSVKNPKNRIVTTHSVRGKRTTKSVYSTGKKKSKVNTVHAAGKHLIRSG